MMIINNMIEYNTLYVSTGDDRRIRVWDLNTGTLFKELRGHTETVHALSFSKDSTMLASGVCIEYQNNFQIDFFKSIFL